MFRKIVQWFKRLFHKLFDRTTSLSRGNRTNAPPFVRDPLTDTEREIHFSQLLDGIANGWQPPQIEQFFQEREAQSSTEDWMAWLQRFGEQVLASPAPNGELGERLLRLDNASTIRF